MDTDEIDCGECGASNWNKLLDEGYPERRRERDRTIREVYRCTSCGAEGRLFNRQNSGTIQLSGAMR